MALAWVDFIFVTLFFLSLLSEMLPEVFSPLFSIMVNLIYYVEAIS